MGAGSLDGLIGFFSIFSQEGFSEENFKEEYDKKKISNEYPTLALMTLLECFLSLLHAICRPLQMSGL